MKQKFWKHNILEVYVLKKNWENNLTIKINFLQQPVCEMDAAVRHCLQEQPDSGSGGKHVRGEREGGG